MLVRDIMTSPAITVTPSTSIQDIAHLMSSRGITALPVLEDDGQLVGIVTEVDLIERHAPTQEPQYLSLLWAMIPLRLDDYARYKEQVRHILAVNAEQLMTEDPTTVHPDDTLERVAELMIKPGHRSLPVVENDRVIGIVTRTDLVRVIEELELGE